MSRFSIRPNGVGHKRHSKVWREYIEAHSSILAEKIKLIIEDYLKYYPSQIQEDVVKLLVEKLTLEFFENARQ